VCECGINIGATVDVEKVAQYAESLPHVKVSRYYKYMCSDPGQELIKKDIRELGLDRVVVASCSPRMHSNPRKCCGQGFISGTSAEKRGCSHSSSLGDRRGDCRYSGRSRHREHGVQDLSGRENAQHWGENGSAR